MAAEFDLARADNLDGLGNQRLPNKIDPIRTRTERWLTLT
jgi:hypothetical protein